LLEINLYQLRATEIPSWIIQCRRRTALIAEESGNVEI